MVNVFLVEDHPRILKSWLTCLAACPDLRVSGAASSAEAALPLVRAEQPDVLLLDLGLPGMSGVELMERLPPAPSGPEVLVLTICDDYAQLLHALRAGASGYLLKDDPPKDVIAGIHAVAGGGSVLSPGLARQLLCSHRAAPVPSLTRREREVLDVIARGFTNREVADGLGVSPATIRTHLEHVYQKLHVANRTEAVTEALRRGIIGG